MGKFTRRDFLKASAGTCAALGTSQILSCIPKVATSTVYVEFGNQLSDLYQMAGNAAHAIGIGSGGVNMSGTTVFIKPNLICMGQTDFTPKLGDVTKAEVIIGIAEQCLKSGADKVTIGDGAHGLSWDWSTIGFLNGNTVFDTTNIQDAVSHLQAAFPTQTIELSCLHEVDEWKYIPSSSTVKLMAPGLKVAKSFYEADHMITIPVLKNHQWADISCAMKNLFGVVTAKPPYGSVPGPTWMMRDSVHSSYANTTSGGEQQAGIEAAFIDILKWRKDAGKQDFAIMDCSIGVEGNGPRASPFGLGKAIDIKARSNIERYFLLASDDIVAVDATSSRIMGHKVTDIRQLRMADYLQLGEITDIDLTGALLGELSIPDWITAKQVEEWGVASTVPAAFHGTNMRQRSQMVNTMAGLGLPVSMIGGLRAWHQRKKTCCKHRHPVNIPVEEDL
jgi:uncharacterized protein (DUF362 family)